MSEKEHLKMYILLKDSIDVGHAVNSCAHAGMMAAKEWPGGSDPIMDEWYSTSFRKVTCKVSDEEFERAKGLLPQGIEWFAVTEMAFDGKEVALVFRPQREWPKFFKFLRLYK
jgi:hypothetical protein